MTSPRGTTAARPPLSFAVLGTRFLDFFDFGDVGNMECFGTALMPSSRVLGLLGWLLGPLGVLLGGSWGLLGASRAVLEATETSHR